MSALERCQLIPLTGDANPQPAGEPVRVQFNPTSMRMSMTNEVGSGGGPGRQAEQYIGASSTTLSFDLVFDTADEGTTGTPVNVRDRTHDVMQFLLPSEGSRQAPPRVRFHWGDFVYDGVVTSLNEDLDLFASNGVPLRSKLTVSIKEQRPEFAALQSGPGANTGDAARSPVAPPPGAPGSRGLLGIGDRTAPAIGGESLAEFAARVNLDPAAWRGLAAGLEGTLSLEAGIEIDFSSSLTAGAGIGLSAGVEAGVGMSLEASLGLDVSVQGSAPSAPGFALAEAGGVRAAIETAAIVKSDAAASDARAAFAMPPGPAAGGAAAARPVAGGAAATKPSAGAAAAATAVAPRPSPPLADRRATGYGSGVPLRPRVEGAAEARRAAADGWVTVAPKGAVPATPALVRDRAAPPWAALPEVAPGRAVADAEQRRRRPVRPCGCSGSCRCGGGHR
jgi:hypothetical protein